MRREPFHGPRGRMGLGLARPGRRCAQDRRHRRRPGRAARRRDERRARPRRHGVRAGERAGRPPACRSRGSRLAGAGRAPWTISSQRSTDTAAGSRPVAALESEDALGLPADVFIVATGATWDESGATARRPERAAIPGLDGTVVLGLGRALDRAWSDPRSLGNASSSWTRPAPTHRSGSPRCLPPPGHTSISSHLPRPSGQMPAPSLSSRM